MKKHFKGTWPIYLMLGGLAILLGGFGVLLSREHAAFENRCTARGGHVTDHTSTSTVTTVNGNGQVGVGTSTDVTYYCLTDDGRILEIM